MAYVYSNPEREHDTYALPDIEVFELTAEEVAEMDADTCHDYAKRYPLATMNRRERDRMLAAMITEEGITGGWFYRYCFPGCLPESDAIGPYASRAEAVNAAQEDAE
jgi:hypothetical protein